MEESVFNSRRRFLKNLGGLAAIAAISARPTDLYAKEEIIKLTILHTNDVHSRVEPFPMDGSRNQGMGGTARRSALIRKIRQEEEHVLLLDAGDIFQGTPYFNFYGGEVELKLMSEMGYDASTLGNHDFDNGVEGFVKQLPHANFPFLCANYDFSDTPLNGRTKPYQVFRKGGLKVGVYGVGIELEGLVEKRNYGNTIYLDPVKKANEIEAILKNDLKCDLVICLSHLGYKYKEDKVSDQVLARNTKCTDLIIGGHTHTFMDRPEVLRNAAGEEVQIFQVGFAGINLGRVDYYFERGKKRKNAVGMSMKIDGDIVRI
jgi:5'-nucleotidase